MCRKRRRIINTSKLIQSMLAISVIAVVAATATAQVSQDTETIPVTAENFAWAETAWNFTNWARLGSDKKLFHVSVFQGVWASKAVL